jgi:hypothetical protein
MEKTTEDKVTGDAPVPAVIRPGAGSGRLGGPVIFHERDGV